MILGVILILLLGAFFLFQVKKVEVYGNTLHTSEEIAAGLSDNVLTRNTLYMMWRYRKGQIPDALPFLSSLHIEMKSPSRVQVEVTEKEPVAYLESSGYIYIDSSGMVLDVSDEVYGELPLVTGVSIGEVALYQKLPVESGAQLETIRSIVQLLADQQLAAAEVRFSDNMEITVFIQDIEARMGQNEYLPEKVANLSKILPRLKEQKGVLHLEGFTGGNETATFSPSGEVDESQSVTGDAASEDTGSGAAGSESGNSDDALAGLDAEGAGDAQDTDEGEDGDSGTSSSTIPMVFDSTGTLVYNVHIENGVVVDSNGTPVSGVTVNGDGNVVDAYMNVIDPATGELVQ